MTSLPHVAAIVLNWNHFEATRACVEALRRCDYPNLHIVVADNGSTDDSARRIEEAFPVVTVLRNGENLGYSRGCNAGIRFSMADPQCRYLLVLNNDCIVAPGSIRSAVEAAESDSSIAIVAAKIVDGAGCIWHAGGTISLLRGQATARGFREPDAGQYDAPCDTEWASGAMMLLRREAVEKAGALPEEYFFGVEEWDYSLHVRRCGWRIRYAPGFAGVHPGSGSHHNHDPKFAYNYYRNKLLFQERHLGALPFALWLIVFRLYVAVRMRPHVAKLGRALYGNSGPGEVDELVFAAKSALRDHGKGALSEATMLAFDRALRERRERMATASRAR